MKKRKLEKDLTKVGWYLERHGSKHDVWTNGTIREMVGRHPDIPERTAKKILKTATNNPGPKKK